MARGIKLFHFLHSLLLQWGAMKHSYATTSRPYAIPPALVANHLHPSQARWRSQPLDRDSRDQSGMGSQGRVDGMHSLVSSDPILPPCKRLPRNRTRDISPTTISQGTKSSTARNSAKRPSQPPSPASFPLLSCQLTKFLLDLLTFAKRSSW